jgi:hypothetical protein
LLQYTPKSTKKQSPELENQLDLLLVFLYEDL